MKVGELLYCNRDGYMISNGEQFCTSGRYYEIIYVRGSTYYIIDDTGDKHAFNDSYWFRVIDKYSLTRPFMKPHSFLDKKI